MKKNDEKSASKASMAALVALGVSVGIPAEAGELKNVETMKKMETTKQLDATKLKTTETMNVKEVEMKDRTIKSYGDPMQPGGPGKPPPP